jgi:hypothetical protein
VASGWQRKAARVSRMDWEEVRVRLSQEFHKQTDLLRHRAGVGTGAIKLDSAPATAPKNFFSPDGKNSERAALLRTHLPKEAAQILNEADEICEGRFRLLGYQNLKFTRAGGSSKDIDWHLDPVHGKRAPLDPWFKIPFLDFAAVGDHKVTWELNRHQHLVTLAKARLLTGDEKYTRELRAQWQSWIAANPYPLGINWGSTLEVAFRSLSWMWVDQLLAEATECIEFRAELAPALEFRGRYIERYLSTYFSPNTHLLGEAVALFFLGTLYPQMPRAAHWKQSGWRIVLREAGRQVRLDGVYFEQSLYYHVYALDFFLYARMLASQNGEEIPPAYDAVLGRMLDVVAALAQAGPAEGFGDDDGGRLWNPQRNRTENMSDPLATGAVIYAREFPAARLTEEAIWLFGKRAIDELLPARNCAAPYSIAFRDGGVYVLASAEPFRQTMAVDAGPQGVGRSGHGHADALSLRLTMDGQRWLVDSGSNVYISKDPADRDTFRGTGAHNTLRVDGVDQAVAGEPFSWTEIPTTDTNNWIAGRSFSYFSGSHDGYERLADPVTHRRHVLNVGGLWLIRDQALGKAEHELEIRWHFSADLEVRNPAPGRVEISQAGDAPAAASMTLLMPQETVWHDEIEISRTLLSPAYGALQSAPLVRCAARVALPAETATLLAPRRKVVGKSGDGAVDVNVNDLSFASMAQAAVQVYEVDYHHRDESHAFFFALDSASADKKWNFGPWSSDASVLYCRIEREKLVHLIAIGGTEVAWQGQPLLRMAGTSIERTTRRAIKRVAGRPEAGAGFFEWRKSDALMNASPDEFTVTPLFEQLTGGAAVSASGSNSGSSNQTSSTLAEKR